MTGFAFLTFNSLAASAAAGLITALAITVRPNLAALAGALALAAMLWGDASQRLRRLVVFGLCVLPGPIVVAGFNDYLHGSPFRSGYGDLMHLYAFANIPGNVERLGWLGESHGWVPLSLAVVPLFVSATRRAGSVFDARYRLLSSLPPWPCLHVVPTVRWVDFSPVSSARPPVDAC
jgi:hypothetical protein